jgi:hypothetical protein
MIRYVLPATLPALAAAMCNHPELRRLAGRGPWTAGDHPEGTCLTRGTAAAWGPLKQGLGQLRYQLADPLPPLLASITVNATGPIAWVDLPGAVRLPVKLATYAPVAIGLDGQPEGLADEYGILGALLWERWQGADLPVVDPQLIAFCRLALMSQTNLTPELIHAYSLLTTESVPAILYAATGYDPKKAVLADGGG